MDSALFNILNSLAARSVAADALYVFLASGLIWIEAALALAFWLIDRSRRSLVFVSAFLSAGLAWAVNQGIGELYFRPRPFADLAFVHKLIAKSAEVKSFPSDHAAAAFAIAGAVFLVDRRWGTAFLIMAAIVSLARVVVGVHFPSDILAGAAVGMLCAFAVHRMVHRFLKTKHHPPKVLKSS